MGPVLDGKLISEEPRHMYTIVGGDGQRYGPVSAEQLRQWVAQGRANGQTQTYREGGEWKPLSSYPEFADLAAGSAVAAPESQGPGLGGATAPSDMPVMDVLPSTQMARSMVQVPGVLVAVTGGIGVAMGVLSLIFRLVGPGFGMPFTGVNPEFEPILDMLSGGFGAVMEVLGIGLSVAVLIGGLQMLQLRNYPFCIAAAIMAMLPCICPACCLGLPAGIWALVILAKPEVRAAFRDGFGQT